MYIAWDKCGPHHLSPVAHSMLHLLIAYQWRNWGCKECNKNHKRLVLDVKRTRGIWNRTIICNFQSIESLLLIGLEIWIILLPRICMCSTPIYRYYNYQTDLKRDVSQRNAFMDIWWAYIDWVENSSKPMNKMSRTPLVTVDKYCTFKSTI